MRKDGGPRADHRLHFPAPYSLPLVVAFAVGQAAMQNGQPRAKRVAYVFSPNASPYAPLFYKSIEDAGGKLLVETIMAAARQPAELDPIMAGLGTEGIDHLAERRPQVAVGVRLRRKRGRARR